MGMVKHITESEGEMSDRLALDKAIEIVKRGGRKC